MLPVWQYGNSTFWFLEAHRFLSRTLFCQSLLRFSINAARLYQEAVLLQRITALHSSKGTKNRRDTGSLIAMEPMIHQHIKIYRHCPEEVNPAPFLRGMRHTALFSFTFSKNSIHYSVLLREGLPLRGHTFSAECSTYCTVVLKKQDTSLSAVSQLSASQSETPRLRPQDPTVDVLRVSQICLYFHTWMYYDCSVTLVVVCTKFPTSTGWWQQAEFSWAGVQTSTILKPSCEAFVLNSDSLSSTRPGLYDFHCVLLLRRPWNNSKE